MKVGGFGSRVQTFTTVVFEQPQKRIPIQPYMLRTAGVGFALQSVVEPLVCDEVDVVRMSNVLAVETVWTPLHAVGHGSLTPPSGSTHTPQLAGLQSFAFLPFI